MIDIGTAAAVVMWALGASIINEIHKEFEVMTGHQLSTGFKVMTLTLWPIIQLCDLARGRRRNES